MKKTLLPCLPRSITTTAFADNNLISNGGFALD